MKRPERSPIEYEGRTEDAKPKRETGLMPLLRETYIVNAGKVTAYVKSTRLILVGAAGIYWSLRSVVVMSAE